MARHPQQSKRKRTLRKNRETLNYHRKTKKDMSKKKKGYLRDADEIHNIEEGKEVVLFFDSSEDYTGIFKGLDEETIMLQSLDSENTIGLPLNRLTSFIERFK